MKIVITGGGTGGHFYPLIAVVKSIKRLAYEQKLIEPKIYYTGPDQYSSKDLYDNNINYIHISAGKRRINPKGISILNNFIDLFKIAFGCIEALIKLYLLMPDIVFAKGGFASFPTLFAARFYRIPVIIHESDSAPGRVTLWASKFATRVALSYSEAAEYFENKKVAITGQPVREDISIPLKNGAYEYMGFKNNLPIITILGGSLGSKKINETIITLLPNIINKYQIIHQTGKSNFEIVKAMSKISLEGVINTENYKPLDFLTPMMLRMIGGVSDIIISRAGSGIFEISAWGVPSILIPLIDSHGDHQKKNAYNYARSGSAIVIEESNLSPQILLNEIEKILNNKELHDKMASSATNFYKKDAADIIASEILKISLSHY